MASNFSLLNNIPDLGSSPLAAFLEATLAVYHRDVSDFEFKRKEFSDFLWCRCERVLGAWCGVLCQLQLLLIMREKIMISLMQLQEKRLIVNVEYHGDSDYTLKDKKQKNRPECIYCKVGSQAKSKSARQIGVRRRMVMKKFMVEVVVCRRADSFPISRV